MAHLYASRFAPISAHKAPKASYRCSRRHATEPVKLDILAMKENINALSEHIMDLDGVRNEYSHEVVDHLHEIANWGRDYVQTQLEKGLDFEESAILLSLELQNRYPELSEEGINNVLIYAHFYTCR